MKKTVVALTLVITTLLIIAGAVYAAPQIADPVPGPKPADETPPDDEWREHANALYQQLLPAVVLIQQFDEGGFGGWHGSGFLISEDGYIATVAHNVDNADTIEVTLYGENISLPASVVVSDPEQDVALIKIEGENLPFVEFGDSDALQAGELLMAIGNPGVRDPMRTPFFRANFKRYLEESNKPCIRLPLLEPRPQLYL